MGTVGAADVSSRLRRAARMAEDLSRSPSGNKIDVLQRIVSRITVRADRLDIAVRTGAVWSSSAADANTATTVIAVPVQLKRCGMAVRLIVQSPVKPNRAPDAKLVALVAKAHDWLSRLTSGRCDSVQVIAQEEKVTSSYVTRVVYLGCLAPDIVEQITTGQHPVDLTAKRLIRMVPLPLDWEEQRRLLGIAG